jgi:flagellar biosynthesis GTPase FlhF
MAHVKSLKKLHYPGHILDCPITVVTQIDSLALLLEQAKEMEILVGTHGNSPGDDQ